MTVHTAFLTDVDAGEYQDEFAWSGASGDPPSGLGPGRARLAGSDQWNLLKYRLRGGVSDGVDIVELDNGALSVSILPTRGMGLWRGSYRGIPLGWKSPVLQPVHPAFVNQTERDGLGWLAGFNEWLCRCGLSSFGPPGVDRRVDTAGNVVSESRLTLHGKIANIPAHTVTAEVDTSGPGTLRVIGEVDETTLFGPNLRLRSTVESQAGSNRLTVIDEVTNRSGNPAEMMLLYHINVGKPFLDGDSRLLHPAKTLAPRDDHAAKDLDRWNIYRPPTQGFREQCYFIDPADDAGRTLALLRNAPGDLGMVIRYDRRQLPWFTVWKNTQGEADGYCTGIEPGTGFPNLRTFERDQGRVVSIPPGETYTMRLDIDIHDSRQAVAAVEEEIATIQGRNPLTTLAKPNPAWTG